MNRSEEIRTLMELSYDEIIERAQGKLTVCENLDQLHRKFARDIADCIIKLNISGNPIRLIMPVGPTGQYPYLAEIIGREKIDLINCWFFFMDEYCDENGKALPASHPLSFKGIAERKFLNILLPEANLKQKQVLFPNELNLLEIEQQINDLGGIDTVFGGIGIHGHVAFNEPEPGIALKSVRKVRLNDFTRTINAVRANVGGNLINFPKQAVTLGMKQILEANEIRLYCRNGTPYDWANCILRIALFGEPDDDYPVTYIRNRNYHITTDQDTIKTPINKL